MRSGIANPACRPRSDLSAFDPSDRRPIRTGLPFPIALPFALNTWERTTLALAHNGFWVYLHTNRDGEIDYIVLNADAGGPVTLTSGTSLTWSYDVAAGALDAYFYTDHGTNAANTVLTICGEQIGMDASDFGTPVNMDVVAYDNYSTGNATDAIEGLTVAPLGERHFGIVGADGYAGGDVAPFGPAPLTVVDFGAAGTNPTETGVMLVLDASRSGGIHGGAPAGNEALLVPVRP